MADPAGSESGIDVLPSGAQLIRRMTPHARRGLPAPDGLPRDPGEWLVWTVGLDAFGAGPVLVFFVFHSAAGQLLAVGPDAAVRWALDMLAEATRPPVPGAGRRGRDLVGQ